MQTISDIKKDREFYRNFSSIIDVLKGIAIAQYHVLEKKIQHFEDFMQLLAGFFDLLDMRSIHHPFIDPGDAPLGVVAVTSEAGLLGGLNHRVMMGAFSYLKNPQSRLIVIGLQGQKIAQGYKVPCKTFTAITDEQRYLHALQIRDEIVQSVLGRKMGAVRIIYPFAISIKIQQVDDLSLLPLKDWRKSLSAEDKMKEKTKDTAVSETIETPVFGEDVLLETHPSDFVEYLISIWMGQKIFDILQLARLAELAARTIHLEESSQKVKEIDKKLQLKYFRARHEIIDQQMRELFTARSIYAG